MAETFKIDREELEGLRGRLVEMGPDYQGASEVIQAFLNSLGYGISPAQARHAAVEFGLHGCSLESIGQELERAAQVV